MAVRCAFQAIKEQESESESAFFFTIFIFFVTFALCNTHKHTRMGIFSFFSREKKEVLDQGLEKTKQSFLGKLSRAIVGKSRVDDEVLDNLEETLVTSDVGVETTLDIIHRIEERVARDKYVTTAELNSVLRDEIVQMLTETGAHD